MEPEEPRNEESRNVKIAFLLLYYPKDAANTKLTEILNKISTSKLPISIVCIDCVERQKILNTEALQKIKQGPILIKMNEINTPTQKCKKIISISPISNFNKFWDEMNTVLGSFSPQTRETT